MNKFKSAFLYDTSPNNQFCEESLCTVLDKPILRKLKNYGLFLLSPYQAGNSVEF